MSTLKADRESLLSRLQSVSPGLSSKDVVEQSSCFVFQGGVVMTYNDEIACRIPLPWKDKDFEGAVRAEPLLKLLGKMKEDEVDLEMKEAGLVVSGIRKKSCIQMEKEILLGISIVDNPEEWHPLHADFADAVELVSSCAGKDESKFHLTCIHLTPKYLETCDQFQMARYRLKTGFEEESLIRCDSMKHVVTFGMTEYSATKNWFHFRNKTGLVLSCRRFLDQYEDLNPLLEVNGAPMVLPKGLAEAVDKASIFSEDNTDSDNIRVEFRPGSLKIKGQGDCGWYTEIRKMPSYKGEAMRFVISPKLLLEITKRHNECEVEAATKKKPGRLRVTVGKFNYVTCLGRVDEDRPDADTSPTEEGSEE